MKYIKVISRGQVLIEALHKDSLESHVVSYQFASILNV